MRSLRQWSSLANRASVSAAPFDLTVIETYWFEGKSYWILYALCRRLAEGKPVIWFHSRSRFLFTDEGVFVEPQGNPLYPATDLNTCVWTLVDSNEDNTGIPCHLAVHDTRHLIIYCSSPQANRWKPLGKTTSPRVAVMNPWTREEISQALVAHPLLPSMFELTILFCVVLPYMDSQPATHA